MISTMTLTWAVALCSLMALGKAASSLPSSSSSSSRTSNSGSSSSSGSSNSFPVFGTKRYARSNLLPSSEYSGQGLSLPVYRLPNGRYYDAPVQPQYFPFAPYQPPASSDYYDDAGYYGDTGKSYYYLPQPTQHRRYQRNNERYTSYGLPTYRGEYKPTPYYYAHGPSYSYSDDHESSNPLDDLHEEMLQEDERERARDYYPVGQEQWYESPSRPDSAFLRNLILYNSQLQNYGRGRQMPPVDMSNEEDFEEYDDTEPDYEYDVPIADTRPSYDNFFGNGYRAESLPSFGATGAGSAGGSRNTFSKLNSFRNSMAKNQIDEDDEEVQELKSLIHQQKNSQRLPPMLMDKMAPFVLKQQQYPAAGQKPAQHQPPQTSSQQQQQQVHQRQSKQQFQQLQPQPQQQVQQRQRELQAQQLQQQQLMLQQQQELEAQQQLQKEQKQQQLLRTLSSDYQPTYEADNWQKDSPSYNAYDYDADEYDDSWSHWDRKRNVQPKKATFSSATSTTTKTTTTTKKPKAVSTTVAPVSTKPTTASTKAGNGQKEVVLPRPTNPRNLFAANLIHAVDETRMQLGTQKAEDGSQHKDPKSSKIYDAIRAMMNMKQDLEGADLRQQLEHQKQLAHIHKRFVSNEESLVQQLDGLKRSA